MIDEFCSQGIPVVHNETILGNSKKAAEMAILETGLSRVLTAMPVLLLGPFITHGLTRRLERLRGPMSVVGRTGIQLTVVGTLLMSALPCALAFFPQKATRPVKELEKTFWHLKDSQGLPITEVSFDKGL